MKNTAIWFVSLLASCAPAVAQNIYLEQLKVENRTVEKVGDNVRVRADIRLDGLDLNTQHSLRLVPVLVSPDGTQEQTLRAVVVNGRTRDKVTERRLALGELAAQDAETVRRRNGKEQDYDYTASVPYERWMLDGRVEIREEVHGCTNCGEGKSDRQLWTGVLPPYVPEYRLDSIVPAPEPVKVRAENRTARLQFRQDSYKILPEYKDNRTELDTVSNSIMLVKNNADVKITGIYITGYASPEGTWEYNIRLSRNRAQSFAEYIAGHNDVDTSLISVEWSGEDWDGFRHALQRSSFPKKDDVIGIIDTFTEDRNECERRMMDILSREEYVWLLRNIYPYLRHCIYRVEYDVEGFDLDRARTVIRENPSDLSLQEMYMVAGSYEPDSVEYAYAMETAARHYPDSPAVMGDRALAALEEGDAGKAVSILEGRVPEDRYELMNILGVAYAGAGEYEKAREAFEKAAGGECANARYNLGQVLGVIDQL